MALKEDQQEKAAVSTLCVNEFLKTCGSLLLETEYGTIWALICCTKWGWHQKVEVLGVH